MFSDPQQNVAELGLFDGQIVADLGAGSGHYALLAAKAVAPTGRVFAVDIQKDLLSRLQKEAHKDHIRNIEVISGDLEKIGGTRLKEGSCDVVIASNILFMLEDKKSFLAEARRIVKSRGRLLVIDWTGSFSGMGPHQNNVLYKDDCVKLVAAAGFTYDREIHAGDHHYGIIFRKS
jgi:ubiquinone/menaquinone biosynthesis C-methylase UbiE